MIKIEFQEPSDAEWARWRTKCDVGRDRLIQAVNRGEPVVINEDLYREQKYVYLEPSGPFHGKCAYCETLRAASRQGGDIEHFRPRRAVTDAENRAIMVPDGSGGLKPHPGYYWLAYDWRNLLPSCTDCNGPSKAPASGVRSGKWNYFPVRNFRAVAPGDESQEEPLLINPVIQDPEPHLRIDDTGVFDEETTPEGRKCIEVFKLNTRESLVGERKRTYDDVKDKVHAFIAACHNKAPDVPRRLDELGAIKRGERAYSAAARVAIRDALADNEDARNRITST